MEPQILPGWRWRSLGWRRGREPAQAQLLDVRGRVQPQVGVVRAGEAPPDQDGRGQVPSLDQGGAEPGTLERLPDGHEGRRQDLRPALPRGRPHEGPGDHGGAHRLHQR